MVTDLCELGAVFDSRLGPDHDWQQLFRMLPASQKVVIHEEFEL